MKRTSAVLLLLLVSASVLQAQTSRKPNRARRVVRDPHTPVMINVTKDVRLEVIDWGGKGPALVFLPGLGNTAHVFDEFVSRFTDKYHVYGITRRGFGESSVPPSGYDTRTLVSDMVAVLDSLHIRSAVFAGHSIAGDELTLFATSHPERTLAVIYLDAMYDHSNVADLMKRAPGPPSPMSEADGHGSVAHLQERLSYAYGMDVPLNDLYQTLVVGRDGRIIRDRPSYGRDEMIKAVQPVSYSGLRAPVLALFAIADSPRDMLPRRYADLSTEDRVLADSQFVAFTRFQRTNIERVRKELPAARVVEVHGARHYIFVTNKSQTAAEMHKFLAALKPNG